MCVCVCKHVRVIVKYIAFVFERFLDPCIIELFLFFIVKRIECFM